MAELIVALDVPTREAALRLVDCLGAAAPFHKVGLELYTRVGPRIVEDLRRRERRIFLDLKLYDIPRTVAAAAGAAAELGVDLLTVHASGGARMVGAAREAVEGRETRLLAVTVLTSFEAGELGRSWGREGLDPREEALRLAELAVESGAHGVVCSPEEAALLRRRLGSRPVIVTPGIRLAGGSADDQARVATPRAAAEAGADYLVVGRPVTRAEDPVRALSLVRANMEAG